MMKAGLRKLLKITTGISLVVLTILITGTPCFAGAWTAPEGKTYGRMALNYYSADENFNRTGDSDPMPDNGEFVDRNISLYLEHGALDILTLVFSMSYKYMESENDLKKADQYAFSDIDLAAKVRLYEGKAGVVSVQGLVKIPEAYSDHDEIPPGGGQYDYELKAMYGRFLYPVLPGYCSFEAGYRFRMEEPADEFRYLIEFGIDITRNAYGRIKYDAIIGMDNADTVTGSGSNPSFSSDYDLAKLDMAVGYKFADTWGVELGAIPEISGENISKGTTWCMALWFKR